MFDTDSLVDDEAIEFVFHLDSGPFEEVRVPYRVQDLGDIVRLIARNALDQAGEEDALPV